jgi:hypothetical protein
MTATVERIAGGTYSGSGAAPGGTTASLTTDGTDRFCLAVCLTGRQINGAADYHEVASITGGTGMTWSKVVDEDFTYNDSAASGSFPNNYWHCDVFKSFAAAQQTAQTLTFTMAAAGDTFVNHGWAVVFVIDGVTDLDTDATNLIVTSALTNVASTITSGAIDTDSTTPLVILVTMSHKNGGAGDTHTIPSGYSTAATISGNSHFQTFGSGSGCQADISAAFLDYGSAQSGLTLTGTSEDNWWTVAVVLAPTGGSTTNLLVTSAAAEVMHTGDTSVVRASSVAAETLLTTPSVARVSSVALEVLISTELGPPLDGSKFFEATFHTKPTLNFSEEDYDSIWSMGDRNVSGIMTFGEYDMTISPGATIASSHNGNYAFPLGSGLAITSNPLTAGAAAWFDFNGEEVDLRGFKLIGTEEYTWADTEIWTLFGGLDTGVLHPEPYTADFDAFIPAQATENTDLDLFETEFTFQPRDGQAWSHYEYVFRSSENLSEGRFANEIHLKVAHSPLDGGDRRPDNLRPDKRVAFSMSSDWTWTNSPGSFIDPQYALFDGLPIYLGFPAPGGDQKNGEGFFSIIKDPVETNGIQTTVGAWFQFEFPRKVIFKHLMLVQLTQAEEYVADVPQHYGTWHWEYSDDGLGWTVIGDPWSFCEDANFMVAPRTGRFDLDTTELGDGATHWRMVLDAGPAFRDNYSLAQFIFNLDDVGALSNTLAIAFTDDADNAPPTPTVTAISPYNVAFTDGTSDVLTFDLTNVPNFDGTLAFTDGTSDVLEFYSDLLPSIFAQTVVISRGRA